MTSFEGRDEGGLLVGTICFLGGAVSLGGLLDLVSRAGFFGSGTAEPNFCGGDPFFIDGEFVLESSNGEPFKIAPKPCTTSLGTSCVVVFEFLGESFASAMDVTARLPGKLLWTDSVGDSGVDRSIGPPNSCMTAGFVLMGESPESVLLIHPNGDPALPLPSTGMKLARTLERGRTVPEPSAPTGDRPREGGEVAMLFSNLASRLRTPVWAGLSDIAFGSFRSDWREEVGAREKQA